MNAEIMFMENGDEYRGTLTVSNADSFSFDPDSPNAIMAGAVRIEIDEAITAIEIDGKDMTIYEAWAVKP